MKKVTIVLSAIFILLSFSFCSKNNESQKNEIEEIDSVCQFDSLKYVLDSVDIENDSNICGYWFEPHAACVVNVILYKDSTFRYMYVERDSAATQIVERGKFDIEKEKIRMKSDNGKVYVLYRKYNDTNCYLTGNKSSYLVGRFCE
jgi:uncharacterized secreted protein with C-terminal beta-propeller domain